MYVLAYLAETRDPTERKRLKTALEGYVSSRGLPELHFVSAGLQEAIANVLQRGDVLIVPSLSALGASPSAQETLLLHAMSAGVSVHLLSLMSPIEQHLPGIREGWRASAAIEEQLARTAESMATREEEHQAEMLAFQDTVWPAPGSEDTELGVLMELEVRHGEASV
jgi:DNA invertase Pin-like site-specific DNA recombinase